MPLELARHGTQRPPPGPLRLIPNHPLTDGLIVFIPFNDFGSKTVWEVVNGLALPQLNGPTWGNGSGSGLSGLVTNTSQARAEILLPNYLKVNWPITIVWSGYQLATPNTNAVFFAAAANNTNAPPYEAWFLGVDGVSHPELFYSWGAGSNGGISAGAVHANGPIWVAGILTNNGQFLYVDNPYASVASANSTGGSAGVPGYSSTSVLALGCESGVVNSSNVVHYVAHVYNRALSNAELALIKDEPFCMVESVNYRQFVTRVTHPSTRDTSSRARVRSATTWRDLLTRFRLRSVNVWRNLSTRIKSASPVTWRDSFFRLRVRSATVLRDTGNRFRLASPIKYRDESGRFRISSSVTWRALATRYVVSSPVTYRFQSLRISLKALANRDASARSRFLAQAWRATSVRFLVIPGGVFRDLSTRVRIRSPFAWLDVSGRYKVGQASIPRDTGLRALIRALLVRDTPARLSVQAQASRDTPARLRVISPQTWRTGALRARLQALASVNAPLRVRLRGLQTRDTSSRYSVLAISTRNQSLIARVQAWATRDAGNRYRLRSDLVYSNQNTLYIVTSGGVSRSWSTRSRFQSHLLWRAFGVRASTRATAWRNAVARAAVSILRSTNQPTRFRLRSINTWLSVTTRSRLRSITTYRDANARSKIRATSYVPQSTRLRVRALSFRTIPARFRTQVATYTSTGVRFSVFGKSWLIVGTRFRLQSPPTNVDIGSRFRLRLYTGPEGNLIAVAPYDRRVAVDPNDMRTAVAPKDTRKAVTV